MRCELTLLPIALNSLTSAEEQQGGEITADPKGLGTNLKWL